MEGLQVFFKVGYVVMNCNLPARQHMLKLELAQVRQMTRLGEGKLVALIQKRRDLLAHLGLGHTRRLQQSI